MAHRLPPKLGRHLCRAPCGLVQRAHYTSPSDQLGSTLAHSRAYLGKLQSDIRPHIDPLILRVQSASDTLKRWTHDVHDSKEALKRASRALNELTGYNHIELVKHKVHEQAQAFEATRDSVQLAKRSYETAIETRSSTQREINELLQRKHLWTGDDVTRFTELYRLEHEHSRAEINTKELYRQAEKQMDREYMALARSIMERYHEEQLWSDKIRSVSTYGTWALMVVNLLLFVAVQTVFEPRKRKRLTDQFEELLVAKVDEEEAKIMSVFDKIESKDTLIVDQQQTILSLLADLSRNSLLYAPTEYIKETSESHTATPQTIESSIDQSIDNNTPEEVLLEDLAVAQAIPDAFPVETESLNEITLKNTDKNIVGDLASIEQQPIPVEPTSAEPTPTPTPTLTPRLTPTSTSTYTSTPTPTLELIPTPTLKPISTPTENIPAEQPTMVISKKTLVLYSLESAIAGGLITALAVFFWN